MSKSNNADTLFYMLVGMLAVIIVIALLVVVCMRIKEFSLELRCLNEEIERAQGDERKHWIRARRRLWLSLLPFVKY